MEDDNMKQIITRALLSSSIMFSLLSCNKEMQVEKQSVAEGSIDVTLISNVPSARTLIEFDGATPKVYWSKSDKLGVWCNDIAGKPKGFTNQAADKATASFNGSIDAFEGSSANLYAVLPYSLIKGANGTNSVDIFMLKNQYPSNTESFDKAADVLISDETPISLGDDAKTVVSEMTFGRMTSVVKVAFTGSAAGLETTEKIEKMSFTVAGATLAGLVNIDLVEGCINNITDYSSTVNVYYTNGETVTTPQAFFVVAPCEIPAGTSLTFTMSTDKHHISKTVSAPSAINLSPGRYQEFSVNLSDATVISWTKETLDNASLLLGNEHTNADIIGYGSIGSSFESRARGWFSDAHDNIIVMAPSYDRDAEDNIIATYAPGLVSLDASGAVKKIIIAWDGATWSTNKVVDCYVKETNYNSIDDLFNESARGILAGSASYYNGTAKPEFINPNYGGKDTEFDLTASAVSYYGFGITSLSTIYTPQITVYWAEDNRAAQSVNFPSTAYVVAYGEDFAEPALSGAQTTVRYTSNNKEVATVDPSTGEVTAVGAGEAVITARASSDATYKSASASYTLTVTDSRAVQTLTFHSDTYEAELDEGFTSPAVSGAQTTVTWAGDNDAVATVNPATGEVTLIGVGTVTVTATAAADETYQKGTASYTLTVAITPRVYETITYKATWEKVADDNYTLHLRGHYAAKNLVAKSEIQAFFRYKVGSGSQITTTVQKFSPNTTGNYEGDFEEDITDLPFGATVTYFTIARVGGGIAANNTGASLNITIGEENWDTLAAWEPTGAAEMSKTGESPVISVHNATDTSGATVTYSSSVGKAIKTSNGQLYLTGVALNDTAIFEIPVTGYKAGETLRIVFDKCYSNVAGAKESFTIAWSSNGTDYTTPEAVDNVPGTSASSAQKKTFAHSFASNIDSGSVFVRLVYTTAGSGTKSLYLGNIYFQKQAE